MDQCLTDCFLMNWEEMIIELHASGSKLVRDRPTSYYYAIAMCKRRDESLFALAASRCRRRRRCHRYQVF